MLIGATPERRKELIGFTDGPRICRRPCAEQQGDPMDGGLIGGAHARTVRSR
jgi:hypothetical protein